MATPPLPTGGSTPTSGASANQPPPGPPISHATIHGGAYIPFNPQPTSNDGTKWTAQFCNNAGDVLTIAFNTNLKLNNEDEAKQAIKVALKAMVASIEVFKPGQTATADEELRNKGETTTSLTYRSGQDQIERKYTDAAGATQTDSPKLAEIADVYNRINSAANRALGTPGSTPASTPVGSPSSTPTSQAAGAGTGSAGAAHRQGATPAAARPAADSGAGVGPSATRPVAAAGASGGAGSSKAANPSAAAGSGAAAGSSQAKGAGSAAPTQPKRPDAASPADARHGKQAAGPATMQPSPPPAADTSDSEDDALSGPQRKARREGEDTEDSGASTSPRPASSSTPPLGTTAARREQQKQQQQALAAEVAKARSTTTRTVEGGQPPVIPPPLAQASSGISTPPSGDDSGDEISEETMEKIEEFCHEVLSKALDEEALLEKHEAFSALSNKIAELQEEMDTLQAEMTTADTLTALKQNLSNPKLAEKLAFAIVKGELPNLTQEELEAFAKYLVDSLREEQKQQPPPQPRTRGG